MADSRLTIVGPAPPLHARPGPRSCRLSTWRGAESRGQATACARAGLILTVDYIFMKTHSCVPHTSHL